MAPHLTHSLVSRVRPGSGGPVQAAPHHARRVSLLTVAALWVGGAESCKSGLAQVTAFPLHVLLTHTLPGHRVTGGPWHRPIWVTLAG